MRRRVSGWLVALVPLWVGCGDANGVVDPGEGAGIIDGLTITASMATSDDVTTASKVLFVQVRLVSRSRDPITVFYEAGCPVRLRLYRLDQALPAYDESRVVCHTTTLVPLVVPAGGARSLTSGPRMAWTIHGDSLEMGHYRATAIVRLRGDAPVELEAGRVALPNCGDPVVTCVYPPSADADPASDSSRA